MTQPVGGAAVVTGATSGIGRAIVEKLVKMSFRVVGGGRRTEVLESMEASLNTPNNPTCFTGVAGDAADPATLADFDRALARIDGGVPEVCVVNAGRGLPGTVVRSDEQMWEELLRVNVLGALRQMRWAGERMVAGRGRAGDHGPRDIVVIGSVVGRVISPSNPVYGATKFAIASAAEALRRELAPLSIRVTLINPGFVRTEFQARAGYDIAAFDALEKEQGPFLQPENVADVVSFVITQPPHVHVNEIVIRPTRQVAP
jgi:NADP-dependent 3-hydroxy acid dehydrogenase YdfG